MTRQEAIETGNAKKINVVDKNGKGIYNKLYQYPSSVSSLLDWGDNFGFVDPYDLKKLGWKIVIGWRERNEN